MADLTRAGGEQYALRWPQTGNSSCRGDAGPVQALKAAQWERLAPRATPPQTDAARLAALVRAGCMWLARTN